MITIRTMTPADAPQVVAMRNRIESEPIAVAQYLEWLKQEQEHPGNIATRMVAVDEAGKVLGFSRAAHMYWMGEGKFILFACVAPGERQKGIGRQLFDAALAFAQEKGATGLECFMRGDDPDSWAWAQRRGFVLEKQRTESVLDLSGFDMSRFDGHLDRVRAGGIRLITVKGNPEESLMRGVYDVDRLTTPDIPIWDGTPFPAYEDWRREFNTEQQQRFFAIALDGDQVVGVSILEYPTVPGASAYTGYTGVLREYRGRGIALAIKLLTIEEALSTGAPRMRTNNDPDNPPMLAVNEKLGYQMVVGPMKIKRVLEA